MRGWDWDRWEGFFQAHGTARKSGESPCYGEKLEENACGENVASSGEGHPGEMDKWVDLRPAASGS